MNSKYGIFAFALMVLASKPISAACVGNLLPAFLQNPSAKSLLGVPFPSTRLALVKIAAVYPDKLQRVPQSETGTLKLVTMESTGSLSAAFSVRYWKRETPVDCKTWDFVVLKPGKRLLMFVQPEKAGWSVPELPAGGVVTNVENLPDGVLQESQKLFLPQPQIKKPTAARALPPNTILSAPR